MSSFRRITPVRPTSSSTSGASQLLSQQATAQAIPFTIPGTRQTSSSTQVSTGIPSLDLLLGGGISTSHILLVREDEITSYSTLLVKYFVAQGIVCGHDVVIVEENHTGNSLLKDLPCVVDQFSSESVGAADEDSAEKEKTQEKMKIAWRYQGLRVRDKFADSRVQQSTNSSTPYCSSFDITKPMDSELLKKAKNRIHCLSVSSTSSTLSSSSSTITDPYSTLLTKIKEIVTKNQKTQPPNVLRIAIPHIASPFFTSSSTNSVHDKQLHRFMFHLRSLVRDTNAVVLLTTPAYLYPPHMTTPLELASDIVIQLDSFTTLSGPKLMKEYNGLLKPLKLPFTNALVCASRVSGNDRLLAFKVRRKRFLVETFSLPPDFDEEEATTTKESGEKNVAKRGAVKRPANGSCGASLSSGSEDW